MNGAPTHHRPLAVPESRRNASVVKRIRKVIDNVELDCECRARLDDVLTRFTMLEDRRVLRQQLVRARQHRERIKAILDFLQEVDDLITTEPDRSVYTELALLFEEVAAIAAEGADSLHRLGALRAEHEREGSDD